MSVVNAGLCGTCAHAGVIASSRESVFLLCRLSLDDSRFRKYPSLPVLRCPGYQADTSGDHPAGR